MSYPGFRTKKRRLGLLFFRCGNLRSQLGLGLLGERRKSGLVKHGQVGQNLTVHFDGSLLQAVHEAAVGQTNFAGSGVDTGDPQSTELTLALTTVTVGILPGLHHRLLGDPVYVLATATVTLGLVEDFFVTCTCGYTAFNSGHCFLLTRSGVGHHGADGLFVRSVHSSHAAQLALALGRLLGQDVALESLRTLDATTRADLDPLSGAALGLHLGHEVLRLYHGTRWLPTFGNASTTCHFLPPAKAAESVKTTLESMDLQKHELSADLRQSETLQPEAFSASSW